MSFSISIQKFGSSVLHDESDLPQAVHAIYADLRRGHRVVAVVSALGNTTDELLREAHRSTPSPDPRLLSRLLSTGEARAAALLALALERAGIPVALMGSDNAGLVTEGDLLDAHLVGLDEERLRSELAAKPVVVLPGFVGRRVDGELTLLGRGGSDLTAIFVASRLRAERCVLFKDVDGLYEWDPNDESKPKPRRYLDCSYSEALSLGGGVVQPKAIAHAGANDLSFELGRLGAGRTRVHSGPSCFESDARSKKPLPLRVGMLGLGTVGGGVLEHLEGLPELFDVRAVLVRDPSKYSAVLAELGKVEPVELTEDPDRFFGEELDVVVEAMGGTEPAGEYLTRALDLGLHVVSANKAVLAQRVESLDLVADKGSLRLLRSASVGGVVPMLESALRCGTAPAQEASVRRLEGVLNGTSNFVLEQIALGEDLEEAVRTAQVLGLAEANPTLDLDGTDVAHKLELLARAAFPQCELRWRAKLGVEAASEDLFVAARLRRGSVKLFARAERDPHRNIVHLEVAPRVLGDSHPLASLSGAGNGVQFELAGEGPLLLTGAGAGRWPTAESVLGDLLELHRSCLEVLDKKSASFLPGNSVPGLERTESASPMSHSASRGDQ